jgi:hypothetical protein
VKSKPKALLDVVNGTHAGEAAEAVITTTSAFLSETDFEVGGRTSKSNSCVETCNPEARNGGRGPSVSGRSIREMLIDTVPKASNRNGCVVSF